MRGQVEMAARAGDRTEQRASAMSFARWLAARDRSLDEAALMAATALELGEDVELRRELAAWLESLGEPEAAAKALEELARLDAEEAAEASYVLMRVGVLYARAGRAADAAASFGEATRLDMTDALSGELLGTIASWAPDVVASATAAEAYVESSRRRARAGSADAELEDLSRAFAMDRECGEAAETLAEALERRGRSGAADEVLRAHTLALGSMEGAPASHGGLAVAARLEGHARRRQRALARGDVACALGAALDEGLDHDTASDSEEAFDGLLLRAGMLETMAARLDARAEQAEGNERARRYERLARLYAGPLADPARAVSAHTNALAADPDCEEAILALEGAGSADAPVSDPASVACRAWVRSTSRDGWERARALADVAMTCERPVRAVLLAVAAERAAHAGDSAEGRRLAEQACLADPNNARCVATLADLVAGAIDRTAAAALEHAINLIGPRAEWCAALANALETLGENAYAVSWTQRFVALRPGDRRGFETMVKRILRAGDGQRLGDALAWLLSQPHPFESLSPLFSSGLRELGELDPDRAAIIARRALDVFGPKDRSMRDAMLKIADGVGDQGFGAAVLERWLATAPDAADLPLLYAQLADRLAQLDDTDGEARVIARAVREVGTFPGLRDRMAALLGQGVTADGELALMEARAELLATQDDRRATSAAWRDFGAALWDLAGDRHRAVRAWLRAAKMAPARGYPALGVDLIHFAGPPYAFECLSRVAEEAHDDVEAGSLFGEAARAALAAGDPAAALEFAKRALLHNPAYADALEIAERAGVESGRVGEVSSLYDIVAGRALGRFGQRAAHYRGARFFEQRGESALALRHAALAFTAVPGEGASLLLLERTAQSAGDRGDAVRAVELVAERAGSNAARAAWLLRAASLAGGGEDGARRRLDALLRAALVAPNLGTLALLADAVHDLVRVAPEERAGVELRLSRASRALVERLDGPEGARMAIALGEMLLTLFEDCPGALAMLERALVADSDIDEYERLMPLCAALARAPEAAAATTRALEAAEQPMANVGVPALRVIGGVAAALGSGGLRGRAAVLAAERDPSDDTLVLEADAAVKALGDASLERRLSKRVPPSVRVHALRALAELRMSDGRAADAVAALERAVDLSAADERGDVEHALRRAYDAAGRGSEFDERAQKEASSGETTPRVRAERWTELAERREQREDFGGALRALVEAARLDPDPVERWGALERVAELAGDDDARIGALGELAKRVRDEGRVAVLRRLARAYEGHRDFDAAERIYRGMLEIDPDNEDVDQAVEGIFAARGDYDRLAEHLRARAERLVGGSGQRETLRALRLRRSVILEQRLGRVPEACEELTKLLAESPDSASALRYLADLRERMGEASRAAPLWRRAAALEADPNVRNELELRAARASKACGDLAIALVHVRDVLSRNPTNVEALALRVELARAAHDDPELGAALEALASVADVVSQAELLVEAAHAATRAGDLGRAVAWAQRAAMLAPESVDAQLTARSLEYRLRGAGAPDDARRTIEGLANVDGALAPREVVLRAFLLAEALDVVQGGAAGMKELTALEAQYGEDGLLALGLGERLARTGRDASALPYFELAMRGDLQGLRKSSSVALAAAEAAARAGQLDAAATLLESAAADAEARLPALLRLAQLAGAQRWFDRLRTLVPELGKALAGDERARTLAMAGRVLFASRDPSHHQQAEDAFATALEPLAPGSPLRAEIQAALEAARENRPVSTFPPDVPHKLELVPSDPPAAPEAAPAAPAPSEADLTKAFAEGSIEAGDALARLLLEVKERSNDVVRIRRQQVERAPGNLERLALLQEACLRDDDKTCARAVEHVLRAFDPRTSPLAPPPLSAQLVEDGMLAVLTRPSHHPVAEALALVWEGAAKLFLRDPASYGITGLERVVPGTSTVLARLYQVTIRVLDVPRIPLFVPRGGGPLSAAVALLQPPSVIISGESRDETSELRFVLGRGLSAALPQNVLLLGLPDRQSHITTSALLGAFGPPELGRSMDAATARVAESFWQLLPPRTQRRLQELLVRDPPADVGDLTERAHQSGRRVGLFLSGDFGTAGGALLAERGVSTETARAPGGLEHLCAQIPELADLLLLAVSPEYSAGRWHAAVPSSTRLGSGRFNIV